MFVFVLHANWSLSHISDLRLSKQAAFLLTDVRYQNFRELACITTDFRSMALGLDCNPFALAAHQATVSGSQMGVLVNLSPVSL